MYWLLLCEYLTPAVNAEVFTMAQGHGRCRSSAEMTGMQPGSLRGMIARALITAVREIRFARRLFVTTGAAVIARLGMVLCGVREMLGRSSMMLDRSARLHALASSEIHGGRRA